MSEPVGRPSPGSRRRDDGRFGVAVDVVARGLTPRDEADTRAAGQGAKAADAPTHRRLRPLVVGGDRGGCGITHMEPGG
ncbi:hypothetical protein [Mycobacterium sp. E342]|uniref:hypothetical protein n=1 Tax=Mycobacterium sp. E342 TaxID=1834147 RepID=UPI0012EAB3C4|nr:hypothetical protein [Mycobacterium sp. E342]